MCVSRIMRLDLTGYDLTQILVDCKTPTAIGTDHSIREICGGTNTTKMHKFVFPMFVKELNSHSWPCFLAYAESSFSSTDIRHCPSRPCQLQINVQRIKVK